MKVCKACFAHVRDLKRLRGHLTHEAALMAANALVGSRLDYRGLSALDLRKLQCVKAEVIPLWKSISTLNFQSPPAFSAVLTPAMPLVYEY